MKKPFTSRQQEFLSSRRPFELDLNKEYILVLNFYGRRFFKQVKLIKPTPKGFNILNEDTGKCILYPHIYPDKKQNRFNGYDKTMTFWLNKNWRFLERTEENLLQVTQYVTNQQNQRPNA